MAPACHHDLEDTRRARGVGGTSGRKRAKKVLALELMTGHGMAAGVLLTQAPARKADRPPPRVTLQNRRGSRLPRCRRRLFLCLCVQTMRWDMDFIFYGRNLEPNRRKAGLGRCTAWIGEKEGSSSANNDRRCYITPCDTLISASIKISIVDFM